MHISRYTYWLPLLIVIFSCARPQGIVEPLHLGQVTFVDGETLSAIPPNCYTQIGIIDSLLVLCDICDDFYFHFYRLEEVDYHFSAGIQGRGPNDFLQHPFIARSDTYPLAVSQPQGFYKQIDIGEKELFVRNTISLAAGVGSRELVETSARLYGKNTSQGNGLFFYQELDDPDNFRWVPFPATVTFTPEEKSNRQRLGESFFAVNERQNTIVAGMRFYNQILFLDLDGNLNKAYEVIGSPRGKKSQRIDPVTDFPVEDIPVYVAGVTQSANLIYLAWYDLENDLIEEVGDDFQTKLFVFDWSGELVKTYATSGIIGTMAVTDDDRNLYATKLNPDGTTSIIKLDLGER